MDGHIWSFNADIALPLETIAREVLNKDRRDIADTKFYAANICAHTFVEAMDELLRIMDSFVDSDEVRVFRNKLDSYWGKGCDEIPKDLAISLFDEFKGLIYSGNEDRRHK